MEANLCHSEMHSDWSVYSFMLSASSNIYAAIELWATTSKKKKTNIDIYMYLFWELVDKKLKLKR